MGKRLMPAALFLTIAAWGQTQIDLNKQVRNALPYASGGTNAVTQIDARKSVGTPHLVATDFAGADIGEKINNAFASFPSGTCGTVEIPRGSYTYSHTIYIASSCYLEGVGKGDGNGTPFNTLLTYNGPPATPAIWFRNSTGTGYHNGATGHGGLKGISLVSAASPCPSGGMLTWNPLLAGPNDG